MRALRLLPLMLLALAGGCRRSEFAPDAKFVDLYVELKLATVGYANNLDKVNEVRRVILAQHHETPAAFHDQYVRLVSHPEAWRKFQEDVITRIDTFQSGHQGAKVEKVEKAAPVVNKDTVSKVESHVKPGKVDRAGKVEKGK